MSIGSCSGRAGSWWCRHGTTVDVTIAVGFVLLDTGVTLAGGSWWPAHPGTLAWALLGVQALACLSLAARRRLPLTILGVLAAFSLVVTLLAWPLGLLSPAHDGNVWAPYATALAAYGPVLACRSRRTTFVALAVLTVIVARPWQPSAMVIMIGVLRTAIGPLLALYFAARARLVQALTERAQRAERERHLLAEQARADERARLAAEMHDVVTHRVSLMVLQAGALGTTAADEQTRQAAEELRVGGCRALDELRDLVGILQTPPDGDETPPSTSDVAALVADSTAGGTPAELDLDGDPGVASPVVGRSAYRIVREALTNVRKHAPGARVLVRVRYEPDRVRLAIHNTAPAGHTETSLAATGSGTGIAGLRQRVELVGGTLNAGPTADDGYGVDATLPAYVPATEPAV